MKYLSILLLALLVGCGTLDKSGAYAGNTFLYQSDQTVNTAYTALDSFESWELANRAALLATNPKIKVEADYIRTNAPQWFKSYFALRSAYLANPTGSAQADITATISLIQTALTQATEYLATSTLASK